MALGLRGSKGVAAPPFTAGPYSWDQFVAFTGGVSGVNTPGTTYYVSKNGNNANDGKSWVAAKLTIQAAVDLTGDRTGDVVLVGPGKWQESVLISNAHDSVKVIAVCPGWETQMRPGDATTKHTGTINSVAAGAFAFVVGARSAQIRGFCCDGGGGYSGIYVGDAVVLGETTESGYNASGVIIEDCLITGSGEGKYGVVIDGASSVIVRNNVLERWLTDAVCLTEGQRTDRGNIIENNTFLAGASGVGVRVVAGSNLVQGTVIKNNSFSDTRISGSAEAFGTCIITDGSGGTFVAGNFFGTAGTKLDLETTDFFSGNFKGTSGTATETYVSEA